MNSSIKKIILIPAYNPEEILIDLVSQIKCYNFDIIVINDGSNIQYNNIFTQIKNQVILIDYKDNKGKGYAIKQGLKYIKTHYKEDYVIVTMDADGQHSINDAKKLAHYNEENLDSLVLGSRKLNKNIPIKSKIGNSITRFIFLLVTSCKIHDTQTGLRAFSYKLVDSLINIPGNCYEYEMNVLLTCQKLGIKIDELEIETIYFNNNACSHFKTIRDSFKIYVQLLFFKLTPKKNNIDL